MKAVIIDDEPLARDAVRHLLGRDPEIEIAGACSGAEAVALIERTTPDILFLDVQMPEVDGFDVLQAVGAVPAVVFVTAYEKYAVHAFEVSAIDYLLKPFDDARFAVALHRAKERVRSAEPQRDVVRYVHRFLVRTRDHVVVVNAADVDWIQAADYYASLHVGTKTHLLREPLADLEKRLDPQRFVRVHRSAIVNVERVREIHPLFRGDCALVLADGTRVRLSRTRREAFMIRFAASPDRFAAKR
jgi:two-component system LytT family response regulator